MTTRIDGYALIGDCHSAALVGIDGSIDWTCFPRFDAPAQFCAILDAERGGSFSVRAQGTTSVSRAYLPGTNVLCTRFETDEGTLEVADLMPVATTGTRPSQMRSYHAILRRVRCVRGVVHAEVSIRPRFEYGRFVPHVRLTSEESAEAVGGADALHVTATRSLDERREGVTARWRLREGDTEWVEVAWGPSYRIRRGDERPTRDELRERFEATVAFWESWSGRCYADTVDRDAVIRSALTLKALTYAPTGAVVAAPTTSLPEEIGGERNWDYRYTWIRDGTLTLIAVFALGVREEAEAFRTWMQRTSAGRPEDLQIMYGIAGERSLPEFELEHLTGHLGSRPVRVGNGAAKQRQLDCYGQLIEAAYLFSKAGGRITPDDWNFLCGLADIVTDSWAEPDQGIWEIRAEPRHFVHSKLNCWAALARVVAMAERRRLPAPIDRWRAVRDEIRERLLADATSRGWFSQALGTDDVDASVLLVPAMGFLPTSDPLVQRTIEVVHSELGVRSDSVLLHRYHSEDGLSGGEGVFLLCSFWLVDCLIYSGRLDEAAAALDELRSYANDVGLWAEEVDPSDGRALGNFPQAFTHMAHIRSSLHLRAAQEGRIDFGAAYDFDEAAVDRLIAGGRELASGSAAPRG